MVHPAESELSAYVLGMLEGEAKVALVDHVSTCDACAKKLRAEAEAELRVIEVAERRVAPVVALPRPARRATGALVALAAAAAFLLFARGSERGATQGTPMKMTVSVSATAAPIPLVTCPDAARQAECVSDAHRRGLYVAYPPWAAAPRFGGSGGRGPSRSPFGDHQM